jgi:hypothetical protein
VFEILEKENQYISTLREAIDRWLRKYEPQPFIQLLQGITLQSETMFAHYSSVQCLQPEIASLVRDFGSPCIRNHCVWAHVGQIEVSEPHEAEEASYWNTRLVQWSTSLSESDSASSSFLSGASTRSLPTHPWCDCSRRY